MCPAMHRPGGYRRRLLVLLLLLLLLLVVPLSAPAQERFTAKLALPGIGTAVIAEGEYEARSTGSFSVRLYEAAPAGDETTFFLDGLVRPRDGVVERVFLADVGGDGAQDVVVVVRSVGTGNYQSAQAFAIVARRLVFLAAVEGLAHDADPLAALRDALK